MNWRQLLAPVSRRKYFYYFCIVWCIGLLKVSEEGCSLVFELSQILWEVFSFQFTKAESCISG